MKKLNIFIGVQGSGKTTLYEELRLKDKNLGTLVSFDNYVKNKDKITLLNLKAYMQNIYQLIKNKQNFSIETAVVTPSLIKILKCAKEHGFSINFYYVWLNSCTLCKNRVENRIKNGGHSVPSGLIDFNYLNQYNHLNELISLSEAGYFIDNSYLNFKFVASVTPNEITIFDKSHDLITHILKQKQKEL